MRNMQDYRERRRRRNQETTEPPPLKGVDEDEDDFTVEDEDEDDEVPSIKGGIADARVLDDAEIDQMLASVEESP